MTWYVLSNWSCMYEYVCMSILKWSYVAPISGLSNVKSPGALRSSISNRRFARKRVFFLENEVRRANSGDAVDSGKSTERGAAFFGIALKTSVPHILWIFLTPGHLGQITRVPQTFFMLGHLTWSGGLTWGDLRSQNFPQNVPNKYHKSYTKNGGPAPRPFSAMNKKPELALRNLLSKRYIRRERDDGGGRKRSPKRSWLRKYLLHAVPGHCVGLPARSLLSLMGSSMFSSPEFRYRTVGICIGILQALIYCISLEALINLTSSLKQKIIKLCWNLLEETASLRHHVAPFWVNQGRIRPPKPYVLM